MRVGLFDLEMTNLHANFGFVFCGVVWDYAEKKLITHRLDDYPVYKLRKWDDTKLVSEIRDTLETFDIIIGYNSLNFDVPFLNTRLIFQRRHSLYPIKHVDLYRILKWKLRTHNFRLDTLSKFFEFDDDGHRLQKTELSGITWTKAACGDKASLTKIVQHCQADVMVLLKIYNKTKQFITFIK